MNRPKNVFTRRSLTVVLTMFVGIGLATALLVFGQVNQALAQGINVDGDGSDWDPAWVVVVDPYDCAYGTEITATRFSTGTGHTYSRWGYEVISFYTHFVTDTWYFRLDTDGRPGDSDSNPGTVSNPGVGTTAKDSGNLASIDPSGLGPGEAYRLYFDYNGDNDVEDGVELSGFAVLPNSPNTKYQTYNPLFLPTLGYAAYSDAYTPTGVVEFSITNTQLYPAGECRSAMRVRAQAGSNYSAVSNDEVPGPNLLLDLLDFEVGMNVITVTGSNVVTYSIPYTITGNAITPAHNAYITQTLDANSYFDSCSGGASCSHAGGTPGGVVTWLLSTPITPGMPSATGIVTSVIRTSALANQTSPVRLSADEGLCAESSTTFSPTLVSLSELRAESVGLLNRFWWAALPLAGAAAALFVARRKARAV
jgi:hypothetical protein